jgi:predicted nucleic acid-binding protein
MNAIVVDASVAASWLFDDEDDPRSAMALRALEDGPGLVPQLWHYEMRNILLVAVRRGRISEGGMVDRVAALDDLPLATDNEPNLGRALALASLHNLSFYDALYLELACRREAALATLDARLNEAARLEGVSADR